MSTNSEPSVCSSGCLTQDHATYGDCLRAKSFRIAYCQSAAGKDATRQKRFDAELGEYRAAVAQGMEPDTTRLPDIRRAVRWSNENGVAYSEEVASDVKVMKHIERTAS